MTQISDMAVCPSCKKSRPIQNQSFLCQTEEIWFKKQKNMISDPKSRLFPLKDGMRQLALQNRHGWFWACDECLKEKKALQADVLKHNIGMGTSFAAYINRVFQCTDCHQDFIFSASEQKHWFETLHFLIWVYPKQCLSCRAIRRGKKYANASLAKALEILDPSDPDQLGSIAELYQEIGSAKKASEFHSRARNALRKQKK